METLGQSEPYFVKCIRSNADKVQCDQPDWSRLHDVCLDVWSALKLFIISRLSLFLLSFSPLLFLFNLPSLSQLPLWFNDNLVLRQLRYTGMLETVRIRQSGYSIKYSFKVTSKILTVENPLNILCTCILLLKLDSEYILFVDSISKYLWWYFNCNDPHGSFISYFYMSKVTCKVYIRKTMVPSNCPSL